MANETDPKPQPTWKGALLTVNPKIVLAFFLVIIAASLVVFITRTLVGNEKLDAGTIALLASFITMFIKMASDGVGYQFSSSAGSDKKDETQAKVASSLAEKVAPIQAPNNNGSTPWWSKLTDLEKSAISTNAKDSPRTAAFITAATTGIASAGDLDDLVSKGLLTQARADEIKAS